MGKTSADRAPTTGPSSQLRRGSSSRVAICAPALALSIAGLVHDPSAPAADPKRALALVAALVAAGWLVVAPPRSARPIPLAWWAALVFVGLSALSLAHGAPSGELDLAPWIAGVAIAAAAARQGPRVALGAARLVATFVGAGSAAIALVALARGGRGLALHGGQGNPNWLGLLLAVCVPLTLDLALELRRRVRSARSIAAFAALAVEILGLVISHSRVAICALVIALVVARPARSWRRRASVALVAAAGATVLVFALDRLAGRIFADGSAASSLAGRGWIAATSLRAAVDAPIGVGLGGFARAFLDAQGRALTGLAPAVAARRFVNATTAHGDVVQAAVESGFVAALALVAFVGLGARSLLGSGSGSGSGSGTETRLRRSRAMAGASLVALGVCMVGDSPLRQPAIVIVVALVAAALRRPASGPRLAVPRAAVVAAGGALALAASWLLADATRAWLAARARSAAVELAPDERAAALARATRIDPNDGEAWLDLGLLDLARGDGEAAALHLARSRPLLANVGTDSAIGEAQLALGDAAAAEASYRAALARAPGSARARLGLAEALRRLGRDDDAEREATVAERLLPGDPRPRALLDRIREGRMDR